MHLGELWAFRTKTPCKWEPRFNPFVPYWDTGLGQVSLPAGLWLYQNWSVMKVLPELRLEVWGRLLSGVYWTLMRIRGWQFIMIIWESVTVFFLRGEAGIWVTLKTKKRSRDLSAQAGNRVWNSDLNGWLLYDTRRQHGVLSCPGVILVILWGFCGVWRENPLLWLLCYGYLGSRN